MEPGESALALERRAAGETVLQQIRVYGSFVRVGHTVFALPFALVGALLAWREAPFSLSRLAWILVAMVTARSAAMGFNRLVDADDDAKNPRTEAREMPRGLITRRQAAVFVGTASTLFLGATYALGPLCFALAPLALAIAFWYSVAKRYTSYTQMFLGLAVAVAPVGGWLAAGGRSGPEPWLLALAIGTWVGGFDIVYACQDVEFDRAYGLRSMPVRFGIPGSLAIARGLHVVTIASLIALGLVTPLGWLYPVGVGAVAVLLGYEQSLVSADDLSRVKQAFDLNGYVGILYVLVTAASLYVG